MQSELKEFNQKTKNKDNLFEELKKIDEQVKSKALQGQFNDEDDEAEEIIGKY